MRDSQPLEVSFYRRRPPALATPLRRGGVRGRPRQNAALLWARAMALVRAPQRLELTLAITAARFVRCRGAGWLAQQSDSDYAREQLGIARSTFDTWARVGQLAMHVPESARGVANGSLTVSALAELARLPDRDAVRRLLPMAAGSSSRRVRALVDDLLHSATPRPPDADAAGVAPAGADCERRAVRLDPQLEGALVRWTPRLPAPVAAYLHQTLGVAQLVLGHDVPPHELLAAVIAEASTEIDITVTAEAACRRLGVAFAPCNASARVPRPAAATAARLSDVRVGAWRRRAEDPAPSRAAMWKLARDHPSRALAHRLDRRLKRLVRQRQLLAAQLEDELLALLEADAPRRLGYPSFERFVEEGLGVKPRTAWDHVARARRRRRNDGLALALRDGRVSQAHATELERLARRAFVPRSSLAPWIETAAQVTVRRLRRMVDWGIGQFYADCRAWSLGGFRLPSDDELRTSGQTLMQAAATPDPPEESVLHQARTLSHVPVSLVAEAEALLMLAQMIASLQDQAQQSRQRETGEPGVRPPEWWGLLVILHLARSAWAELALANTHDTHSVLDRDAYQCAAPGCTRRRDLQAHHIRYRSEQGSDDPENLATLCSFHHCLGEHGGILRVRGAAIPDAGALVWAMGIDEHGHARQLYRGDRLLRDDGIPWADRP